jgi:signal transduction histidine kinase/CHASE3 domain sensor protein
MAVASAVVAIVIAVVLTVLIVAIRDQRDTAREAQQASKIVDAAGAVRLSLVDLQSGARGYLLTGQEGFLRPFTAALGRLPSEADKLERLSAASPESRRAGANIARRSRAYVRDLARPLVALTRRNLMAARARVASGRANRELESLRQEGGTFVGRARRRAVLASTEANRRAHLALVAGLTGLFLSLGLIGLFAVYMTRQVVHPIRRVAAAARGLASGDLAWRVPRREGGTEVAELGRTFNAMAASIEQRRAELSGAVERLEQEKERMSRYLAFGRHASLETEPGAVAPLVLEELETIAGADGGALYTVDETGESRELLAVRGPRPPVPPPEGIRAREDGGEELVSPLLHGGRAVARLMLQRAGSPFPAEVLRRMGDLAPQAGAVLAGALALQAAQNRTSVIRAVIDSTPDAIALLDDRGHPVLENPPMKIVRRALVESVRLPGGGYRTNAIGAENDPDAEIRDELELMGAQRTFARYGAPVRDTDGRRIGRLVVLREITREREAERMKDEFFALVSHELRTPLTSILGYLELLVEDEEVPPEQQYYLGIVQRNARRLLRLVGDLLFVAQVEAGRLSLEEGTVDLPQLAVEAVEAARPRAEGDGIELVCRTDELPPLPGDRDRLGQVLDNLITNALKFTPKGGCVSVSVTSREGVAELTVCDTGPGISADDQQQLFERFFRAESAVEGAVPGVGLGLTIVKAICEAHGGRIDVQSEPGAGATFRVQLPMRTPRAAVDQIGSGGGVSPEGLAPSSGVGGR